MRKIIVLFTIIVFYSCQSQEKISLQQMNEYLLNNNFISFGQLDSIESKGMKEALTRHRLLGAQSCNIIPNKKYSHIYIEDGFNDQYGYYNGILVMDNKDVCEITTSSYKLNVDSLSYTKIKDGNFILYTKKTSIEDFKMKYPDEYFRYEIVVQDKVNDLKKCLASDPYTPKPRIHVRSYYFADKKLKNYELIQMKYTDIKDGVIGIPYFKEEKKKEFIDCINNLNILKVGK
ncbi:hypothetical protein DRF59_12930 [Chryseobacterium flavum]|uniref:Lipoprotein n=2 Tax=Chryseobacterium flavum TaxID=415851 RepID=A0A3D9CKY0_9FLAO|nr:hypothetical protein [Chryseobacterium flavum]REC66370.1 hypothetical protein DRF59_12930 [Chryseobacterium flavum]